MRILLASLALMLLWRSSAEPAPQLSTSAIGCVTYPPLKFVACPPSVPGPTGPTGPAGATGATGPQGPAGTGGGGTAFPVTAITNLAAGTIYLPMSDGVNAAVLLVAGTTPAPAQALLVPNSDGTEGYHYAVSAASQFINADGTPFYPAAGNAAIWQQLTPAPPVK
jgi:hypothetical protein